MKVLSMGVAGIIKRSIRLPFTVLILCLVAAGIAWSVTPLESAREAMRLGKYDNALKILTSALQENPVDTNGHLGMTEYYLALQNYPEAQLSAERTVVLNPAYASVVGHAYYAAGDRAVKSNQPSRAVALYETAIAFAPTLKNQARGKYLAAGNALIAKGSFSTAVSAYTQEISLNPAAKKIIADSVFVKGQSLLGTNDKGADRLFAYSASLDSSYSQKGAQARADYGQDLINRAMAVSGEARMKLREAALRYVSKEIVDQAVPPPVWKTVLTEEYVGKGLNDEDGVIVTPRFGTQIKPGDRIVVTGREFQFLKDRWETHTGSFETINRSAEEDRMVGIRAPRGEKIVLEVARLFDE
jgi:tetratricopeptide (TPR) repeat protein